MLPKKILFFIFLFIISFFLFTGKSSAQEKESVPVITVINPIRGGEWHGKTDLLASLKGQWEAIENKKVNATWLWQYTAMDDDKLVNFAKETMRYQEFGLFLEIDRNTAKKAGIQYRGQGPLYHSDGLLLVSYDKDERRRLIDEIFRKFKNKFGFYPKTVGAWWIGGDSLTYMQKKYGIVAAMKAADQFDMDAYSIWGSPWSIPYVSSREHEGIPASSWDDSSKVVILQWAPRDPLNGYEDAMFSLQDHNIKGYPFSYVDYLSSIYLKKSLDNLNVGLENGGTFEQFESYYEDKLTGAKKLEKENKVEILLVKDYAEKFLSQRKIFANSDINYFLSKDYQSNDQSFWYHSANFKAGIHKKGDAIYLIDLRDYSTKIDEDFSLLPNSQGKLRVSTPAIIDSKRFSDQKLLIAKSSEQMKITEEGGVVTLFTGQKKLASFISTSLEIFPDNGAEKIFTFGGKTTPSKNRTFLFDKKEMFLFSVFPLPSSLSISQTLLFLKVLPFVILLVVYVIFRIKFLSWGKTLFYSILVFVILLYARVPYFPLDKSTYLMVLAGFSLLFTFLIAISFILFKKIKSKKVLVISFICIPLFMVVLGGIVFFSRTQLILTPFEIDALQVIKEKKKDVFFVSETDYNVKPIYKAVKPLLYENYHFLEKLTNTHWKVVERPENNMLRLSGYSDKVIAVPRYLGADFSNDEMKINNFKKVFDNGQIAIFEKK